MKRKFVAAIEVNEEEAEHDVEKKRRPSVVVVNYQAIS